MPHNFFSWMKESFYEQKDDNYFITWCSLGCSSYKAVGLHNPHKMTYFTIKKLLKSRIFLDIFQSAACRLSCVSPTPQWLSVFTQLHYSDRTAVCLVPPAQRPQKDLWLSSECLHLAFQLWLSVWQCTSEHWSCHSMCFARGCVKLSRSLRFAQPRRTRVFTF